MNRGGGVKKIIKITERLQIDKFQQRMTKEKDCKYFYKINCIPNVNSDK